MITLFAFLGWRFGLFIAAAFTQDNFSFTPQFPYSDIYLIPSGLPQWVWAWANFDGVHYLTIAQHGYMAQFTQAFFPMFPLVVRYLGLLLNDKFLILSGQLVSFAAICLALFFLKKLLAFDYRPPQIARVITLLLLFPTSFYFAAFYTEAFFLLLVILTFYFARKRNWWACAIVGATASATRVTGIFLLPTVLIEYLILASPNNNFTQNLRRKIIAFCKTPLLYFIPLGLVIYAFYLQQSFGDWLYFWHAQPAFGAQRSAALVLPPQVIWRYLRILSSVSYTSSGFFTAVTEFASFCGAIAVMLVGHKHKVRLSYLFFGWVVILLPSFTGTLSSMPRYVLLAFPLYITLGILLHRRLWFLFTSIIFALLLILFTSYFIRGLWVA